jgi:hypothetical protein
MEERVSDERLAEINDSITVYGPGDITYKMSVRGMTLLEEKQIVTELMAARQALARRGD